MKDLEFKIRERLNLKRKVHLLKKNKERKEKLINIKNADAEI